MSRSFKIINVSGLHSTASVQDSHGRYISKDPHSAAKKAGSSLLRKSGEKGPKSLRVTIQETTQGSNKKIYK